jgi:pimeloyl-ACP methyl ester carboxylesterase
MILGQLSARVRGHGPPVVLLHGNSENGTVFDRMLPYLGDFTTIQLDSRGHGRSARGERPLTIKQLAIDVGRSLIAYRDSTGTGPCGLIGFSDGANIGLELAIHRPDLLAAQVLMGGNVTPGALKPVTNAMILGGYWAMRAVGAVSPAARRRADIWGLMVGQPNVSREQLESVEVPTMIMVGQRDVVPRRESQLTARLIPGAEWVEVAGQSHLLPRGAPKLVADLATAFLGPRLRAG